MSDSPDTAVIGLTGQSGAGKTTVCRVFAESGFAVINADQIARKIMEKGSPCLEETAECFGRDILSPDGSLNRQRLADIVFEDKEKLKQLNAISYPYITYEILQMINKYTDEKKKYVLLDAPTLFESRADDFCDLIISVTASEKNRAERILKRDGISAEQVKERFSSQHSEKFFVNHSDFIIKNNKSVELLQEKAKEVAEKIKEYYNAEEA
ncbi:MAG: dephospho-CoA kinase [Ruminococcus sp.]|nr:dephospho-CoA kinase [Ruminococcus sp.]MCM1381877.1 dephospho-CoA kinase [Muribaculaceae bacterium]MCM1479217.1 dephospho-CoA kinase [Muribaculaceae bacterium]